MKVLESAVLLVIGTVLISFTGMSFALFPRVLSLSNPTLFMEAMAVAGVLFLLMGMRGLYRIHGIVAGKAGATCSHVATA
ncbi:MAG: hypothetical protein V4484_01785 [Pseudomonadota bacterium]